jgi:pilus assembly protein CpaC
MPGLNVRRAPDHRRTAQRRLDDDRGPAAQETTRQNIDALPGMATLPVLGSLFRSRDYLNGETELVIIVEPYIVSPDGRRAGCRPRPTACGSPTTSRPMLFGQLNQAYGTPAPTAAAGTGWQGPVGYVID